jgi:hypothetical protein
VSPPARQSRARLPTRGSDESSLSEEKREATEATARRVAAAGAHTGTETETETGTGTGTGLVDRGQAVLGEEAGVDQVVVAAFDAKVMAADGVGALHPPLDLLWAVEQLEDMAELEVAHHA